MLVVELARARRRCRVSPWARAGARWRGGPAPTTSRRRRRPSRGRAGPSTGGGGDVDAVPGVTTICSISASVMMNGGPDHHGVLHRAGAGRVDPHVPGEALGARPPARTSPPLGTARRCPGRRRARRPGTAPRPRISRTFGWSPSTSSSRAASSAPIVAERSTSDSRSRISSTWRAPAHTGVVAGEREEHEPADLGERLGDVGASWRACPSARSRRRGPCRRRSRRARSGTARGPNVVPDRPKPVITSSAIEQDVVLAADVGDGAPVLVGRRSGRRRPRR